MNQETISFINNLPKQEKAEAMEYIAMQLVEQDEEWVFEELEKRYNEFLRSGKKAVSWDDVKAKYLN